MDRYSLGLMLLFLCYAGVPAHTYLMAKALREPKEYGRLTKLSLVLVPTGYFLLMCVSALVGTAPESVMMKILFATFLMVLAISMFAGFQMHRRTDDDAGLGN